MIKKYSGGLLKIILPFLALLIFSCAPAKQLQPEATKLWQLPGQTSTQMMSYVLITGNQKVCVIDGGNEEDGDYLFRFLRSKNIGEVDEWILTNPHSDHVGAITYLLQKDLVSGLTARGIKIKRLWHDFPDEDWVKQNEKEYSKTLQDINKEFSLEKVQITRPKIGDKIVIDDIELEFIQLKNPEIKSNAINNSSIVFRVSSEKESVMFLSDLGVEGGKKLLKNVPSEKLKSDWVQMAHHGQSGVDFDVYKAISPKGALWPTPKWLWDNDSGGGYNSGKWQTIIVRGWMDKLGVKQNIVSYKGLNSITLSAASEIE